MQIEQFVMAYKVDQDKIRAMLPKDFVSLRPVLRINAEVRTSGECENVYFEFNTPVEARGKRGWLNIGHWSSDTTEIHTSKEGNKREICTKFFRLTYTLAGVKGGCPAEKDNDGCFYLDLVPDFKPAEKINEAKEFCDCEFSWNFSPNDAHGKSIGKTLPVFAQESTAHYPRTPLTAENAAAIPCQQVLGTYVVFFER